MPKNYVIIRVYPESAEELRRRFPRFGTDAERVAELLETTISISTLPHPVDAQAVPDMTVVTK